MVFVQMSTSWAPAIETIAVKPSAVYFDTDNTSRNLMFPLSSRSLVPFLCFQIRPEKIDGAVRGELCGRRVVARGARVVVEAVLRARIHVETVRDGLRVERGAEVVDAGV